MKQIPVGFYDSVEEASKVVEEYMTALHGDFYTTRPKV